MAPQLYDLQPTSWSNMVSPWLGPQPAEPVGLLVGSGRGYRCSLPGTGGAIPSLLDNKNRADCDGWAGSWLAFLIRAVHRSLLRVTFPEQPAAALGRGEDVRLGWSRSGVRVSIQGVWARVVWWQILRLP